MGIAVVASVVGAAVVGTAVVVSVGFAVVVSLSVGLAVVVSDSVGFAVVLSVSLLVVEGFVLYRDRSLVFILVRSFL